MNIERLFQNALKLGFEIEYLVGDLPFLFKDIVNDAGTTSRVCLALTERTTFGDIDHFIKTFGDFK